MNLKPPTMRPTANHTPLPRVPRLHPASPRREPARPSGQVLLLDEPYRAMDALTKSIMHEALLEVYDRTKVTIFFITHDLEEAIFLGDRVVVMTTRPAKTKKIVDVKISRPRDYRLLSSEEFRVLVEETKEAVHEEAVKAFEAGERELA